MPESFKSGATDLHRDITHSIHTYQEVPDDQPLEDVIGRPLPHLSGAQQATGKARYCDDMPKYTGELYLALVLSTRAHARIISVDPSDSLSLSGVRTFINADDVPGSNSTGYYVRDEEIFATDEVTCAGQVIGAIVAETKVQAQRAAKMVKIVYEDLPRILTTEEAIACESFFEFKPLSIEKGDWFH